MSLLRVKPRGNFFLTMYFIYTSPLFQFGSCGIRDSEKLSLLGHINSDAGATGTRSNQVQAKAGIVT